MTHDLVRRPEFMIAGYEVVGDEERLADEIPAAWARLLQDLHRLFRAIDPHLLYGVVFPSDPPGSGVHRYVLGVEAASDEDLPKGFVVARVPEHVYAVKRYAGPRQPLVVQRACRDLVHEAVAAGRALDEAAPMLEVYDRTLPEGPRVPFEVYVAVQN